MYIYPKMANSEITVKSANFEDYLYIRKWQLVKCQKWQFGGLDVYKILRIHIGYPEMAKCQTWQFTIKIPTAAIFMSRVIIYLWTYPIRLELWLQKPSIWTTSDDFTRTMHWTMEWLMPWQMPTLVANSPKATAWFRELPYIPAVILFRRSI